ncbi:MAG: hypothetical protein U9N59_16770 [Campylobacterota bacterium]|nr:hypothetical protein [Campylobacterota bacterium]
MNYKIKATQLPSTLFVDILFILLFIFIAQDPNAVLRVQFDSIPKKDVFLVSRSGDLYDQDINQWSFDPMIIDKIKNAMPINKTIKGIASTADGAEYQVFIAGETQKKITNKWLLCGKGNYRCVGEVKFVLNENGLANTNVMEKYKVH